MKQEDTDNIIEFLLVAATTGLSIIAADTNYAGQMGALVSGSLWVWQKQNSGKLLSDLEQKCQRLNREKLDYSALESDEFKALMIQVVDTASKTASDLKREALANALINSVLPPTSELKGKQALLRVLTGMSDEEIIALAVLHKCETTGLDEFKLANEGRNVITYEYVFKKVKTKMGQEWGEEENRVAFEGINQLGLAKPPQDLMWNSEMVKITTLGNRLIKWVTLP